MAHDPITPAPAPPETLEQRVDRLEQHGYPRKLTLEQLAAYRRILDQQATTR